MKKIISLVCFLAIVLTSQNLFGEAEITPELLEQKSLEAREMLEKERVYFYMRDGKLIAREILLAVYSQFTDEIKLIRLKVKVTPSPQQPKPTKRPKTKRGRIRKPNQWKPKPQPFDFSVLTPGYAVERLNNFGIVRINFGVKSKNGENLIFLDAKHLQKNSLKSTAYFPYNDIYMREYFVKKGARFLFAKIREAQNNLCELGVKSRAYSGKLLCEVFPDDFPANIAYSEQTDDGEFINQCPNPETLPPENRIYDDCAEYTFFKFLVHIARNGEKAYGLSASSESASGLMQFMNTPRVPTYSTIVNKYPEAKLIKNYREGAQNMLNSIKAAICLFDMDLANSPQAVKEKFLENYRIAGIFLAIKYNAGAKSADALYKTISVKKMDLANFVMPDGILYHETIGYIAKYLEAWKLMDEARIDMLKEQPD